MPGFPWWFPCVELPGLGGTNRPGFGFQKSELPGGAAVVFEYLHIQELGPGWVDRSSRLFNETCRAFPQLKTTGQLELICCSCEIWGNFFLHFTSPETEESWLGARHECQEGGHFCKTRIESKLSVKVISKLSAVPPVVKVVAFSYFCGRAYGGSFLGSAFRCRSMSLKIW